MLHRALLGSVERFIGILIEHYAGVFPLWLAPEQARILPISDKQLDYAHELKSRLNQAGYRVEIASTSDKLGAKIRDAQLDKVPVMLVVGGQEVELGGATVRRHSGESCGFMAESDLLDWLSHESKTPETA